MRPEPRTRGGALTRREFPSCRFAGVDILVIDRVAAVDLVAEQVASGEPVGVHLVNAYTLTLASKDSSYADALRHGSVSLPDGVPVGWFSRAQTGMPHPGPVRGPGLMRDALMRPGLSHFFLGGDSTVLAKLSSAARRLNPDVDIRGELAPPYGDVTEGAIEEWARAITASGASVVWIGLGTPKQDFVIARLVDRVSVVLIGVGAAFDFIAGTKKEAPERLRGTGLEWIYRLASEPRRLWRRYLIGNLEFALFAARELRAGRAARK